MEIKNVIKKNNSIQYIIDRITNMPDTVMDMPIDKWDEAWIINPIEKFKHMIPELSQAIKNNEFRIVNNLESGDINVKIKYDENISDFDYFTMVRTTHDGTFYFVEKGIRELLFKLIYLQTTFSKKTTDDFFENPHMYSIEYTIGDIVIHRDFGMKNINGMEIYGETNIMVLPIRFNVVKLK